MNKLTRINNFRFRQYRVGVCCICIIANVIKSSPENTSSTKFLSFVLRVGRSVQYSEDSETGDGQRKRFRLSREEEEMEAGIGDVKKKKKKKSRPDQEPCTSHSLEVGCKDTCDVFILELV